MKFLVLKKKNFIIAISIIIIITFILFFSLIFWPKVQAGTIIKGYNEKWKIELPKNTKLEFNTGMIFIDGSVKYTVFTCKEHPNELLNYIKNKKSYNFEKNFDFAIKDLSSSDKIPKQYMPDFNQAHNYARLEGSHGIRAAYLYIIYFPDQKRLILVQDISQYAY